MSDRDLLDPFTVVWETVPVPGRTFYSGARRIFAADEADARDHGQKLIARDLGAPFSRDCIRIVSVKRQA